MAARTVEVVISPARRDRPSGTFLLALKRAAKFADHEVKETQEYEGKADLLVLHGVGSPEGAKARARHVKSGRHAILCDLGYFGRKKHGGYYRVSIDHDHPQAWIPATPDDPSRLAVFDVRLREDADPAGPIVLIGLGMKSRHYLNEMTWEHNRLAELRQRFPGRRIVYRPKPGHKQAKLGIEVDERPIEVVLRGASLVVCRHSNVAIDAIIAGVPFEAVDGAALALASSSVEDRQRFLNRLAWWQWREQEAPDAWKFLMERLEQ